jgi:hypothetical protein
MELLNSQTDILRLSQRAAVAKIAQKPTAQTPDRCQRLKAHIFAGPDAGQKEVTRRGDTLRLLLSESIWQTST